MKILPLVRLLGLVVGLAAWGGVAFADCSSPAGTAGQMVYAGNHNTFAFCNGTNWVSMAGWNNSSGGGASLLNELTDVVTAGATTGSILSYNGSAWVVSSTSAVPSVLNDLTDVNTAGAVAGNVIRYNGSTWVVSDATSVAALASLTDVTLTNLAGRDYLRYDAGTSKWVNISESTVMSTTTMRPGFPDSITCTSSGSTYAMVLGESPYTDGKYYYYRPNAPAYYIGFNADGTYSAHGNMGSSDCVTGSKSVATLYAEGKAFNFIGNADAGSTALGDRITSGTLAMVANSATSYISLSTNGTDWGYLSSGVSYLPTITANKVSSTNVSATYVHLNSATTPLACDSGFTGAMRYTSGTMQVCDGNNWGNIGIGVPGGTIAAFEAVSCPAGWSEYTPARGRFLRGIDTLAAGIDPSGTRAPGNIQEDTLQNLTGTLANGGHDIQNVVDSADGVFEMVSGARTHYIPRTSGGASGVPIGVRMDASLQARTSTETRPKNVAVIYCQYNGYNTELSTGVATLASLSDVAVGGVATGQVLAFDGSSWVPSNTSSVGLLNDLTDVNTAGAVAGNVIRYNGSSWVVSDATGVSTISSLTDVTLTNLAGRDYLRYDAGASKWVNISESTVMSTTTMSAGWPDAIMCTLTNPNWGNTVLYLTYGPYSNGNYYYRANVEAGAFYSVIFTSSGSFSSYQNITTSNCNTSISSLYASGRAFNFIGSANVAGSSAEGDRLTSGTLSVVANSATSIVSLSTNGTTWGYLGNAASYLPTITANKVSSTNISATYVHLNSATTPLTCNAGLAGSMRYTSSGAVQVCNGTTWSATGVSTISSLTDVTLTNLAGRDYLRYDAGASKWVNISESTVMSTTTMIDGWPDAIVCNVTNPVWGPAVGYLTRAPGNANLYGYAFNSMSTNNVFHAYFNPDKSFNSHQNLTTTNCNKSISQLYADGQAFNFIGSANVAGSSAEGDRLTSGTLSVVANSTTSVVSLSTAGTTWGYLGNGVSYLPTLMSGKVSSTNISSTYVQLSSATTPQACSNSIVGAIRYSVGTIQVCNGVAWTSQTTGDNSDLFAVLADQKPTGTHGGSYTANTWVVRDLNTKLYDSIGVTVSSNQFTLPAGTYLIDVGVSAYKTGASLSLLYNVTDAAVALNGTATLASNSNNGYANSVIRGVLVLDSAKTFEIHWRGGNSQATTALGYAADIAGYPETYMNVLITKLNSGGGGDGGNGVSAFNDLTDVNTAGAVAGSYIRYDGSTWVVSTTYDIATPDVDRITSGTLAMVANTAGNYVSLTTGGTTWGYFGQSASYLPTLLTVGGNVSVTGGISVTGNVRAYSYLHLSDERLKDTITTIPNAADILTKLRGTHFRWKSSKQFSYGLIAQEVEKVVPDLVTNGEGLKAVDYDQLAPILLEGWKVHHKAIKALEDENAQLKAAMEGLEQRIRKLEAAGVAR